MPPVSLTPHHSTPRSWSGAVSRPWVPLLALFALGCHPPEPTTAPQLDGDEDTRRPPGVVMDPSAELPDPTAQMSTGAGVAVLQAPCDPARAVEVVRHFFRAVVDESPTDLEKLLTHNAWTSAGRGSGRFAARNSWRARLMRLDYQSLEQKVIYRENEVETYREVSGVQPRRQAGPLPLDVSGDDLLLRVPIVTTRVGSVRLFADEMWFLLKPGPNGYTIAELVENYQLP